MDWREFEQHMDRELKALPPPAAPATLLPRVMTATARRHQAPWYSRAWLTWPLEAQLASVLALTICGVAAWWLMPAVSAWIGALAPAGAPVAAWASAAADSMARLLALGRALWLVAFQPVVVLLTWVAAAAALVAAACWTAANRLALGGASLR